ncbi:PREDICTED: cullin-1-like [Fragaria vesca subsp. vesca]|uniref:cullin-1-like n=1 Tax=Fragaria vesca subsp. vesca TaxID=101020 RepID=UPI0002C353F6|nr:PREDICTED: cullin-1-like [Fragaria vesca subsp. vesca]
MNRSMKVEEGLMIIDEAIQKVKKIVEGFPETKFTTEEYMKYHACVYIMCDKPLAGNEALLYGKFKKGLEDIIISSVLPSLVAKENEFLLKEFVHMWSNYKIMVRWLCRFFEYLDRYYIPRHGLVSLTEASIDCFCNLVFSGLANRIQLAATSLINQERYGQLIDGKLLQDVMGIFMEIGQNGSPSYYETIERAMLGETANFYSRLSSELLLCDSLTDYIQKVNWCILQEKERADHYLHPTSVVKLLQVVRFQLLDLNANKLLEKQKSENCSQLDYQEILSKCACLNFGEDSSTSTLVESLCSSMAQSAHIH